MLDLPCCYNFIMSLFKSGAPSPKQRERLEKIRARGRKHFILYTGVMTWGMSVFLLTSIWAWYDSNGWQIPSGRILSHDLIMIFVNLAIWLTAGYFYGASMWRRIIDPKS